jgi:hypothetical protein
MSGEGVGPCNLSARHRVSHRGAFVLERVHRVRGSSPRVSSSNSYDDKAGSAGREDRVTAFTCQVRSSDTWKTHKGTTDSEIEESCS